MRVAYSTIFSVAFAASAFANPMHKRHEVVEVTTECTTVLTTEYATVDPPTSVPTPSGPPVEKEGYEGWPGWPFKHTTRTKPSTEPAPEQTTPPATITPVPSTPPAPEPVEPTTTPTTTPPQAPLVTTPPPTTTPTATLTATPTPGDSFESTVLNAHNEKRARHGAPPLVYDPVMAQYAMGVSSKCVFAHSGGPYGENLALGHATVEAAVLDWYSEEPLYKYDEEPSYNLISTAGHFTQMVWLNAKKVGCANFKCPTGNFLTCNYDTGNVIGAFLKNVLRPTS